MYTLRLAQEESALSSARARPSPTWSRSTREARSQAVSASSSTSQMMGLLMVSTATVITMSPGTVTRSVCGAPRTQKSRTALSMGTTRTTVSASCSSNPRPACLEVASRMSRPETARAASQATQPPTYSRLATLVPRRSANQTTLSRTVARQWSIFGQRATTAETVSTGRISKSRIHTTSNLAPLTRVASLGKPAQASSQRSM